MPRVMKTIKYVIQLKKQIKKRRLILCGLLLCPGVAFAWGDSTSLDSVLQSLLNYLTSAPARIFALLAIVSVGYGTLYLGKLPKERALAVVIGIGLIFGGAAIMQKLGLGT